jgi:hypothetical protein
MGSDAALFHPADAVGKEQAGVTADEGHGD